MDQTRIIVRNGECCSVYLGKESFKNKYKDIATRWGIEAGLAYTIVDKYQKMWDYGVQEGFDKLFNLVYFRDRRSPEEYAYDLMEGWLLEELVANGWLTKKVFELDPKAVVLIKGSDKDRVMKSNPYEITTEQDVQIIWGNGNAKKVEIQSTRQGRRRSYDHKVGKVKRAQKDSSIFLWVNPVEDEMFLVNSGDLLTNAYKRANFAYGGKETYEYFVPIERYIPMLGVLPYRYQYMLGFVRSVLLKKKNYGALNEKTNSN